MGQECLAASMFYLWISLTLGIVAGLANLFGAAIVTARPWSRSFLTYFIAVGSGFMLATVFTEMFPESMKEMPVQAPLLMLLGYFIVHFCEHSFPAHFHFGEEVHVDKFLNTGVAYTALAGLLVHTFFGGVAIASGFLISNWLGTVIFGAVLLHNVPEGFTVASIMVAGGKSRKTGLLAACALGASRIAGILVMAAAHRWVSYSLALSAGVTLYVAASDLIPEVNKTPGLKIAVAVALGVVLVVVLRFLFLGGAVP